MSALAGCSENLDDEKVEDFLLDNAQVPALIESVDCPSDIEVDEGATFDCEVHTRGGGLEISTLRQVDDEGTSSSSGRSRSGSRRARTSRSFPRTSRRSSAARRREPDRIASVDCPSGIEIEKGSTFRCIVRFDDGDQTKVTIVQRDDVGNVEIKP